MQKIHDGVGSPSFGTMARQLMDVKVPKLFYEGMKKHVLSCHKRKITGDGPLRRPASLPTATAMNEMILMDFAEWKGIKILHIIAVSYTHLTLPTKA